MTINIKDASPALLKVVKSVAKLDNAKVSSKHEQAKISPSDAQNLKKIYTQYERGELETISLRDFEKEMQECLELLERE